MSLISALLRPTRTLLRVKRRISRRNLTSLLTEVAGLSSSQSYALLEELKISSFRKELIDFCRRRRLKYNESERKLGAVLKKF